jgi:hypothetical protein
MKLFISSLMTAALTVAAAAPAFAEVASPTLEQQITQEREDLYSTRAELTKLAVKIDHAKLIRATTLTIAIPATLGLVAVSLVRGIALAGWNLQKENQISAAMFAGGIVTATAGGYIVHLTGKQISMLQDQVKFEKAKNTAAIDALAALSVK